MSADRAYDSTNCLDTPASSAISPGEPIPRANNAKAAFRDLRSAAFLIRCKWQQ